MTKINAKNHVGTSLFNKSPLHQLIDKDLLADNLQEFVSVDDGVSIHIGGGDDGFELFLVEEFAVLHHPSLELADVDGGVFVGVENVELGLNGLLK